MELPKVDMTAPPKDGQYLEISTPGGKVRVSTGLVSTADGRPTVVVEVEPDETWGWESDIRRWGSRRLDVVLTKPVSKPVGVRINVVDNVTPKLEMVDQFVKHMAQVGQEPEWRRRGWPDAHYDEDNDCPCPDHVAMRHSEPPDVYRPEAF